MGGHRRARESARTAPQEAARRSRPRRRKARRVAVTRTPRISRELLGGGVLFSSSTNLKSETTSKSAWRATGATILGTARKRSSTCRYTWRAKTRRKMAAKALPTRSERRPRRRPRKARPTRGGLGEFLGVVVENEDVRVLPVLVENRERAVGVVEGVPEQRDRLPRGVLREVARAPEEPLEGARTDPSRYARGAGGPRLQVGVDGARRELAR